MITIENLVSREVRYCVSYLVSTLAQEFGAIITPQGARSDDLGDAIEQAFELASPIDDWEEAAIQAGWELNRDGYFWRRASDNEPANEGELGFRWISQPDASSACQQDDIEPYQREVFEHWIVSDWLADKLIKHGEKVDKDFCGMIVWARTTTGQGIASDSVIEKIHAELVAA